MRRARVSSAPASMVADLDVDRVRGLGPGGHFALAEPVGELLAER